MDGAARPSPPIVAAPTDLALGISPSLSSSRDGAGSAVSGGAGDGWGDAANAAGYVVFTAPVIPHSAFTAVVPAGTSGSSGGRLPSGSWDATAGEGAPATLAAEPVAVVPAGMNGASATAAAAAAAAALPAAVAVPVPLPAAIGPPPPAGAPVGDGGGKAADMVAREEKERQEYLARLAGKLAALRTGAAAAVGARYMASAEARRAAGRGAVADELELTAFSRELAALNVGAPAAAAAAHAGAGMSSSSSSNSGRAGGSAATGGRQMERTRLVTAHATDSSMMAPLDASNAPPPRGAAVRPAGIARPPVARGFASPEEGDGEHLVGAGHGGGWAANLTSCARSVGLALARLCSCAA